MCYNSIVHKWVQLLNPLYFYAKECCIMKYCPYCGADLLGGTVSFCSECGKSIKGRKTKAKSEKKPPAERKKKTKTKVPKDTVPEDEHIEEETPPTERPRQGIQHAQGWHRARAHEQRRCCWGLLGRAGGAGGRMGWKALIPVVF